MKKIDNKQMSAVIGGKISCEQGGWLLGAGAFLTLDEATSAMDRNTEHYSMVLLKKIKPNCAIFFISHRLNTLKKMADTIYVLENSTLSITGSHEKLMETTNFYSDYWQE